MAGKHRDDRKFSYATYAMMILAVALFVLLSKKIRASLFVSGFIFVNMVITFYKKFIKIPMEIEILTMGIVLCTVNFGLNAGLVVAILGWALGFFIGLDISPFALPMFLGYILMVFVSFILTGLNIRLIGIIATLTNNLLIFTLYHFLFGYDPGKNLAFSISNIALNLILFINIAPFISSLMA